MSLWKDCLQGALLPSLWHLFCVLLMWHRRGKGLNNAQAKDHVPWMASTARSGKPKDKGCILFVSALWAGFWREVAGDKNYLLPCGWRGERNLWEVAWLVPRAQALQGPCWRSNSCSSSSELTWPCWKNYWASLNPYFLHLLNCKNRVNESVYKVLYKVLWTWKLLKRYLSFIPSFLLSPSFPSFSFPPPLPLSSLFHAEWGRAPYTLLRSRRLIMN